ncbi:MAG: hypothetical protein ABSH20_30020, partial [Tepidisphaeraceae bacterium]
VASLPSVLLSAIPTETLLDIRAKVVAGDLLGARAVLVKYSEDQPRDEHGEWTSGSGPTYTGALGKVVDSWVEGSVNIRQALSTGRAVSGDPKSLSEGKAVVAAVAEHGTSTPDLYRGVCRSGEDPHELDGLAALKPGDTFNGNVASWSSDKEIAKDFGGLFGEPRFLIRLEAGAHGLDLGTHAVMGQKEWITDGRFEVVSVDRNVKGGVQNRWGDARTPMRATVITIRQSAVFDAPSQFGGTKAAKERLPWPDEFDSALEVAFDQRMASPDAQTDALHEQRATKYSEDQPRDERGRFGEGGGGARSDIQPGPSTYDRYGTTATEAKFNDLTVARIGSPERADLSPMRSASMESRAAMKDQVARQVGDRLDRSVVEASPLYQSRGLTAGDARGHPEYTPGESMAAFLHSQWADSSGDHNPVALAVQMAANEEFGLKGTAEPASVYGATGWRSAVEVTYQDNRDVLRAYVRAEYDNTQEYLRANGIQEVELFRGIARGNASLAPVSEGQIQSNPLSSWSLSASVAHGFGSDATTPGRFPYVLSAVVPADRVFSTALTGAGCLPESEVIVLGGTDHVTFKRTDR